MYDTHSHVLWFFSEETRLKFKQAVIAERLKQIRIKKQQLLLEFKHRKTRAAQLTEQQRASTSTSTSENTLILAELDRMKKDIANMQARLMPRPRQRVQPANLIVLDNDTDVEPDD